MRRFQLAMGISLWCALACQNEAPPAPGAPGTLGGPCLADGSCRDGLRCDDAQCVSPTPSPADSGVPDAGGGVGSADSGPIPTADGGTGSRDAGAPDAGIADAGVRQDGGTPTDGGVPDSGVPDSGVPADGGARACLRNADCDAGERCRLTAEGPVLQAACGAPAGAGGLGQACVDDADCTAGLCVDGFCSALCLDGSDCANEQACRETPVMRDGASGNFSICVVLPDRSCTEPSTCAEDGRVCGEIAFGEEPLTAYCALPLPDQPAFAAVCAGPISLNEGCEERICLHERCSRLCADDDDCAGDGVGMGCSDIRFAGGGMLRMCVDTCATDADCAIESHRCVIQSDFTDDALEWTCRVPTRPDRPGEACADANQCDHGACVRRRDADDVIVDSYCSVPCETDQDCPEILPTCSEINFLRPTSQTPQALRLCNRP